MVVKTPKQEVMTMKRFSAALTLLLFLTGCGRSPDNYGRQPEIPRTETTATTIAEEKTATSSTTSTAEYTAETTTSTALTAVLAPKQPKKAAIQETTAVSATEPVSSTASADIQTEVQSTANTTNTSITPYTTTSVVTTSTHTTSTTAKTVPKTSPLTTTVTEPPTESKTILPNDGSDYGKASAIYEYMLRNGGGTCVNYACLTYELCEDNGLDCCIVWTQAGLYGHVANIVRVDGVWYVLDTEGGYFLDYNYCFTEVVDIDGNHIADSSIISGKSYDELH